MLLWIYFFVTTSLMPLDLSTVVSGISIIGAKQFFS